MQRLPERRCKKQTRNQKDEKNEFTNKKKDGVEDGKADSVYGT